MPILILIGTNPKRWFSVIQEYNGFRLQALDSVLGVGGSWMFSKSDSEEEYFAKLKEALVEIKE
jgi:hypothetical protein